MKRDMDLVRALLLECEAKFEANVMHYQELPRVKLGDNKLVVSHFELMVADGLLVPYRDIVGSTIHGKYAISPAGYDFLDSVRDESVWEQTKDTARKAGGWTLELLSDIAKGLIKKQIKRLTDVEI